MTPRRRDLLRLAAAALPMPAIGQDMRARTLRLVPSTDLVSLDPVFSTALVAVQHGYHVFDTLYGVDAALRPWPQMAEGHEVSDDGRTWTIRLREGLRFHDGEPVRARDCAASLTRWGKRDTFGRVVDGLLDHYEATDDRTLRVHLKSPFPRLLSAIGKPHSSPAFIMPERIAASTPPNRAVTEMVGSGPYRFLANELSAGNLVAYARNPDYVPRQEAPEWTSGGKVAHFERVEWRVIPDQSTAVGALVQGEVDWLESMSADLVPVASRGRGIRIDTADPLGTMLTLRFNHTVPPFNNPALRRFVLRVLNQDDYLAALTGGGARPSRACKAFFPCTIPGTEDVARDVAGSLAGAGPAALREALRATGYVGERVVILDAADSIVIAPQSAITADALRRAGMNVDLQAMDWGTMLQRRNSKAPPDQGGWGIYHSAWPSIGIADPLQNLTVRGEGAAGWPGWYESAEMERLTGEWLRTGSEAEQTRLAGEIHRLALNDVPGVALGIFYPTTAYRAELQGVLGGSVRYPWNVRRG